MTEPNPPYRYWVGFGLFDEDYGRILIEGNIMPDNKMWLYDRQASFKLYYDALHEQAYPYLIILAQKKKISPKHFFDDYGPWEIVLSTFDCEDFSKITERIDE